MTQMHSLPRGLATLRSLYMFAAVFPFFGAPAGGGGAGGGPSSSISTRAAASGIDLETFDKAVRPQDDFFQHVNGTWLTKTEIPPDKSSYGSFDILVDQSQTDLRAIVEDAAKNSNQAAGSDAQKIGDFYASFMNEA